ncbi:MAG: hypothetical protein ACTSR2_01460 [Candidatus Hodarchaeales archaeon]
MQYMKILMYGQIITAWAIFFGGVLVLLSTIWFENDKKRAWIGYSGLFMMALSIFLMIHYFVRGSNDVSSIIRTLYETFPQYAERLLEG